MRKIQIRIRERNKKAAADATAKNIERIKHK